MEKKIAKDLLSIGAVFLRPEQPFTWASGRGNRIEGRLEKGQKVVVIEDLISTGGSCIEVVEALREAGAEVLGVASIFTYGMQKGLDRMREANVTNYSLSNLDALVEVAAEEGLSSPRTRRG